MAAADKDVDVDVDAGAGAGAGARADVSVLPPPPPPALPPPSSSTLAALHQQQRLHQQHTAALATRVARLESTQVHAARAWEAELAAERRARKEDARVLREAMHTFFRFMDVDVPRRFAGVDGRLGLVEDRVDAFIDMVTRLRGRIGEVDDNVLELDERLSVLEHDGDNRENGIHTETPHEKHAQAGKRHPQLADDDDGEDQPRKRARPDQNPLPHTAPESVSNSGPPSSMTDMSAPAKPASVSALSATVATTTVPDAVLFPPPLTEASNFLSFGAQPGPTTAAPVACTSSPAPPSSVLFSAGCCPSTQRYGGLASPLIAPHEVAATGIDNKAGGEHEGEGNDHSAPGVGPLALNPSRRSSRGPGAMMPLSALLSLPSLPPTSLSATSASASMSASVCSTDQESDADAVRASPAAMVTHGVAQVKAEGKDADDTDVDITNTCCSRAHAYVRQPGASPCAFPSPFSSSSSLPTTGHHHHHYHLHHHRYNRGYRFMGPRRRRRTGALGLGTSHSLGIGAKKGCGQMARGSRRLLEGLWV